jgi:hypothetical protein
LSVRSLLVAGVQKPAHDRAHAVQRTTSQFAEALFRRSCLDRRPLFPHNGPYGCQLLQELQFGYGDVNVLETAGLIQTPGHPENSVRPFERS